MVADRYRSSMDVPPGLMGGVKPQHGAIA